MIGFSCWKAGVNKRLLSNRTTIEKAQRLRICKKRCCHVKLSITMLRISVHGMHYIIHLLVPTVIPTCIGFGWSQRYILILSLLFEYITRMQCGMQADLSDSNCKTGILKRRYLDSGSMDVKIHSRNCYPHCAFVCCKQKQGTHNSAPTLNYH